MFHQPPAEADMQRHFRVTPPSVHQMVLALERDGLISRQPGVARSIAILVPTLRAADPRIAPVKTVITAVQSYSLPYRSSGPACTHCRARPSSTHSTSAARSLCCLLSRRSLTIATHARARNQPSAALKHVRTSGETVRCVACHRSPLKLAPPTNPGRFKGGTPNVRTAQDVVHGKLPFVREAIEERRRQEVLWSLSSNLLLSPRQRVSARGP